MTVLRQLLCRAKQAREARRSRRREEASLRRAVEQVVQASSPAICTLKGNCREDLRSPVARALAYIAGALDSIPGPVEVSAENWDRDPLLKALFVVPGEIDCLLRGHSKLKLFFSAAAVPQALVLLTAIKKERTVFGIAADGGSVRRDVAQTAVEFYDHRLTAAASTETEIRSELMRRALNVLVTGVLEKILKLRSLKEDLVEQRHILSIKLKIQQTRNRGLDIEMDDASEREAGAQQVLDEIARKIERLGKESDSPKEYLRHLVQTLSTPQEVMTVTPLTLRLNWMGVKQCSGDQCVPEIHLAELDIKGHPRRVAVLAQVNRRDVGIH